jgi:hypothetical protein
MSATWLYSALELWNQQRTIAAALTCHSCQTSDSWCIPDGPPAVLLFDLDLNNAGMVEMSSLPAVKLQHVANARPFSISVSALSPVSIVAGSDGMFVLRLVSSTKNKSVSDADVLAESAVFVTKVGSNSSESSSAYQDGFSFIYNLQHFKAENVTLQFQDLSLGGILAT